jgi:glycogen synthase
VRIAYISYEYPPDSSNGGIATYIAQASRMMARMGHEVEVFAASPSRQGRSQKDGILEHWIHETNRRDFGTVAGHVFAARHAEEPFDVLESPEYNADGRKAIGLVPGVPLVVRMHTPSLLIAQLNAPTGLTAYLRFLIRSLRTFCGSILRRGVITPINLTRLSTVQPLGQVEQAHARQATIVAAPCYDLCKFAEKIWGIPKSAIRHSPHPYSSSQEYLELQPSTRAAIVGFVGRLEKRKGIEVLVRAIPKVLKAIPRVRFRFIGASQTHDSGLLYDEWIKKRLSPYKNRLEFVGKIPLHRMHSVYADLDICIFPSLWENFPNVCLEAMAAGRAVVASGAGGMREMLDEGRVGRVIPPGDSVALADEVISLLNRPADCARLGALARKRVLDAYNENVIGQMMEQIYAEAIQLKQATIHEAMRFSSLVT